MDPLRKGIAIGMLFGSGKEAELNDKEVEIETSDIRESQTAIFEYDPADEDPQGDPPGPWDGYSLFTIDLSNVQEDLEDLEEQIADLEEQLEDMQDCRDAVIAKLQEYNPNFNPETCEDITDEIDDQHKTDEQKQEEDEKEIIDELADPTKDPETQEGLNGDPPPPGDEPLDPKNPDKVYEVIDGNLYRTVSWWIGEVEHNNTMYPLWHATLCVNTTTWVNGSPVYDHYEYSNIGWWYGDKPTQAEILADRNFAVEYNNNAIGMPSGNNWRLHISYEEKYGFPGYNVRQHDYYF